MDELKICHLCNESETEEYRCHKRWSRGYLEEHEIPQEYAHNDCPENGRMRVAQGLVQSEVADFTITPSEVGVLTYQDFARAMRRLQ